MRRPRPEQKLDRTMDLFWKRGYNDTSVEELVSHTGLHRAAVYGGFGSKQGLFEASLRRYRETVMAAFLAPLARPDAALIHLEQFFRGLHHAATESENRLGCLVVSTAVEVSPHNRSVARIVSGYLDEVRALLRAACVNAQARGEIVPDADVDEIADFLLGAVLGLWTLARSPAPAKALGHYITGVLRFIDGLRARRSGRRPSRTLSRHA
jgi:TetR/AcrR family transcriptional regulator, transcriptional repressor for nem operon